MAFNLLLVEDTKSDIDIFNTTIDRLNDSKGDEYFSCGVAKTIAEANEILKKDTFQGCVVDIRLKDGDDGNDFIDGLINDYRIPVVIYTATPDVEYENIKCYRKGDAKVDDVIGELEKQNATGIFNVLGGKGIIENDLSRIFWKYLYPNIDVWKKLSDEEKDVEAILLRYTLAYLLEQKHVEGPRYSTEEMYLFCDDALKTGAIYESKGKASTNYILLSPPCDVALHNGKRNTDHFLLCQIDPFDWKKIEGKKKDVRANIKDNITNKKGCNHWLPDNAFYEGGIINFRKVKTSTITGLKRSYRFKGIKLQDAFVKNVLQRFSSYYSRQGQPDFDFDFEIDKRFDKWSEHNEKSTTDC